MAFQHIEREHSRRSTSLVESHVPRQLQPAVAEEFMAAALRLAASLRYGFCGCLEVA